MRPVLGSTSSSRIPPHLALALIGQPMALVKSGLGFVPISRAAIAFSTYFTFTCSADRALSSMVPIHRTTSCLSSKNTCGVLSAPY